MAKKDKDFQVALQGKKIPILTLDNKWYKLFDYTEKTPSIKKNEQFIAIPNKINFIIKPNGLSIGE